MQSGNNLIYLDNIDCNEDPYIVNSLLEIKFTNLIDLNISTNKIDTIEILSTLYMPNMQYLWLCNFHFMQGSTILQLSEAWSREIGPTLKLLISVLLL